MSMLNINVIRTILKPALEGKCKVKAGTLMRATFIADVKTDKVELKCWGTPKDEMLGREILMNDLKLSDYPIVFKTFKKEFKKSGYDLDRFVKEYRRIYLTIDYSTGQCKSELHYYNADMKPAKTKEIISKF